MLTVAQLVKEFPVLYGARMFTPVFTKPTTESEHNLTSYSFKINFNIITISKLSLTSDVLLSGKPSRSLYTFLISHMRATCPSIFHVASYFMFGEACKL
jgi:hypothetical protein